MGQAAALVDLYIVVSLNELRGMGGVVYHNTEVAPRVRCVSGRNDIGVKRRG